MDDPNASHLDDEALSAALDAGGGATAPDEAAAAHLAACAACTRRRDALAAGRAALASAPVEPLDELARRRLLARALAEAPASGGAAPRRPWYLRPAVAGGVAAALLAVLAAVPLLGRGGTDSDETAAVRALADTAFLGDLGELSDPAVVRSAIGTAAALEAGGADAGSGEAPAYGQQAPGAAESAPAPVPSAAPYSEDQPGTPPAAPAPPAVTGRSTGTAESQLRRDRVTAEAPAVLDRAVSAQCAGTLADGPGRGARLVATAVGTYRGTPAVVIAFARGSRATAYVAARDGCRVLDSYRL